MYFNKNIYVISHISIYLPIDKLYIKYVLSNITSMGRT